MKNRLNLWLSQRARRPGILAYGVRYPDRTLFAEGLAEGFPRAQWEAAVRDLHDVFQVLEQNQMPDTRVRWSFAEATFHCLRRPDDICLGVFASCDPALGADAAVDQILAEFLQLEPDPEPAPPPTTST